MTQERDQTIEAQLAETTSELRSLRLKQRELEARNNLLEKVAALSRQPSSQDDHGASKQAQAGNRSTAQVLHVQYQQRHCKHFEVPTAQVALNTTGCPTLALFMQVDLTEVFLKILEKCGLCRSHGGSALVLTGRDIEEHIPTEDPATMPIPELAKIYTVSSSSYKVVIRLYTAEPSWLASKYVCQHVKNHVILL